MLLYGFQRLVHWFEQVDIPNQLQGNMHETAQPPPCASQRSRLAHPAEHLPDTPCLRGLHIHAHQFRQGMELLLR